MESDWCCRLIPITAYIKPPGLKIKAFLDRTNYMKKFEEIKSCYLKLGVAEDNIDYAITSVSDGSKREHILESLTAGYRGMSEAQSAAMLDELFLVNGGEYIKENQGGYLFGTLLSLVGVLSLGFLIAMINTGEWKMKFLILSVVGTLAGLIKGPQLLIKSLRGKYRENDDPFAENE